MTAATARLRRVAVRDGRELGRALGALAGLGVAIAAAVAVGSMLGGGEPRISIHDTTTSGGTGLGGSSVDADVFDDLFGPGVSPGAGGAIDRTPRGGGDDDGLPGTRTPPTTPDLPVEVPESPIEVPVTPDLLSPDELVGFIEDATEPAEPTGGLLDGVTETVGGVTKAVGGIVGGVLGGGR